MRNFPLKIDYNKVDNARLLHFSLTVETILVCPIGVVQRMLKQDVATSQNTSEDVHTHFEDSKSIDTESIFSIKVREKERQSRITSLLYF